MKLEYSRNLPSAWKNVAKVFTALGHEQRQRIVLLFEKGEQLNVGQIVDASTLSRTAVAHHLRALYEAKILGKRKIGKEVYYWLDANVVEASLLKVIDYLRENYQ